MPIVYTSSSEAQIDASVAESLQGDKSVVDGCASLKRRSQQCLEEARAEKRVKVESGVGLSCDSFYENGVDIAVPLRSAEGCQDRSRGDELTKEEDVFRPFVGDDNPTAIGNGADLSDLLRDLGNDSEDIDDDEFGGGPPSQPADLRDEFTGNSNVNETEDQALTPLTAHIVNTAVDISSGVEKRDDIGTDVQAQAADISSEVETRDDIGTEVQAQAADISSEVETRDDIGIKEKAHAHETIGKEKSFPEIITLDSDSDIEDDDDDDFQMFDHLSESLQLKKTVNSELGGSSLMPNENSHLANSLLQEPGVWKQVPNGSLQVATAVLQEPGVWRQVLNGSLQVANAVTQEPGVWRQVPNGSPQLANAVMQEPGVSRQMPNGNPQVANAMTQEPGVSRQMPNGNPQVANAVMQEPGVSRQMANGNPQAGNPVKVEHGSTRQVPNWSPQVANAVVQEPGVWRQVPNGSLQMANVMIQEPGVSRQMANGSPQVANAMTQEPGVSRQMPNGSPQVANAMTQEPGVLRQMVNGNPQAGNPVKVEHGSTRQVPNGSLQMANAVVQEPGVSRQMPNGSPQVANAVMQEPGVPRQMANGNPQAGNPVKVEHGSTRQVPNWSPQVANAVVQEPGVSRQMANGSPQVANLVKAEHGSTRQVPHNMQSPGFQAANIQFVQAPPGCTVQIRVVNGKLQPYIVVSPVSQLNPVRMPTSPFSGNLMRSGILQPNSLPYRCPSSGPSNGYAQEATSSGEQAGGSHGLNPPTTSAAVPTLGGQAGPSRGLNLSATSLPLPTSGDQAGPSHRWNPSATSTPVPTSGDQAGPSHRWIPSATSTPVPTSGDQAGPSHRWIPSATSTPVPTSGDQAGPSHRWNPSATSTPVPTSRDQAGPSHRWDPLNALAVVPFNSGASKGEPGLYDNTNLGPQSVPAHNQLAVVKPCYDSTVSTPRINVTHAMKTYTYYINKAKNDRAREALARMEATPNEFVKEGHRRGLDCRPDIVAYNEMKKVSGDVNPGIIVGDLPGVEIGDKFTYRHQMAVVGLHRLPNVGIDYGYPPPHSIPTATAIVLMPKAGYVDDKDYGNTILYTGQGGRKKRNQGAPFVCDQELKKGNLALAKNYERKLPVRVIRGHSVLGNSGPGVLGYTYDGLYMITNYEFSVGLNGFKVYKFSMERLEGQPPIPPCIGGCTAHAWNTARGALGALPLQVMDPGPVEEDVKQLCI
ncbi:hypothetical protein M758_6G189400 [Ceratodon purpureus]|nr:hypothetical protein M758_6G189400 [Ceratodon purpureus]